MTSKISVVVLADAGTSEAMGRIANALTLVAEAAESGDEAELIFDGAGTRWIPELVNSQHKLHPVFEGVRDRIAGACEYCANAFGVKESVRDSGVPFLGASEPAETDRRRIRRSHVLSGEGPCVRPATRRDRGPASNGCPTCEQGGECGGNGC